MTGLWDKLRGKIRRDGPLYALQLLSRRIPARLFYLNSFIVFALDPPVEPPEPDRPPRVREAGRQDLDLLATEGRSPTFIEARLARGARVWIAQQDSRMVAHAWTDPRSLPWDGCLRLTGAPGDIWSIDGWVAPDRRGQGCYTRVKGTAAYHCGKAGYGRLLAAVDALNRNSIRANRAIGAVPVSRGFVLRLLGLCLVGHDGRLRAGVWSEIEPLELRLPG